MSITVTREGNNAVISIRGQFNFSLHRQFRDAYEKFPPTTPMVVDLAGVQYLDSSALGMLLLLHEHCGGEKSNITVRGCNPKVAQILQVANFKKLMKFL
ncbi:MAG: STAS domain-containing protein [Magnetococcales bacterium]|nr:STAS domain-containing protein [Magnetococcales bacterium]